MICQWIEDGSSDTNLRAEVTWLVRILPLCTGSLICFWSVREGKREMAMQRAKAHKFVQNVHCALWNVHFAMCTVHSVHYATMRIAQYAVCNIPICNVPCQVCSVSQCAIFSMQRRPDQTRQYSLAPNEVCSSLIKSIFSTCLAFSQHF